MKQEEKKEPKVVQMIPKIKSHDKPFEIKEGKEILIGEYEAIRRQRQFDEIAARIKSF